MFCQDVQARQYVLPQWEVAAFWRATATVWGEHSVADLAQNLDRWHQRVLSAIAYFSLPSAVLTEYLCQ
jgi:hypothetical protein